MNEVAWEEEKDTTLAVVEAGTASRRLGAVRRCVQSIVALAMVSIGLVVAAPQAQAYTFTGYIDVAAQCHRQGQFAASFGWYWNPNSWYCYTVSVPAGVTYAGTPNMAAACANQYPTWRGYPRTTPRVVAGNNVFGWRCVNY